MYGCFSQLITPFEKDSNATTTYKECITYYESLHKKFSKKINILDYDKSDVGYPIQLVVIDKDGLKTAEAIKQKKRTILFINNGIHPGEPEGIDASMMLARDIVTKHSYLLENVSIIIIPVYNIYGALQRNSTLRANQDGPKEYGFRGNAKNLDLNRDFIKSDALNTFAFQHIFTDWRPNIFIDTHTSNGADYQYTMTLIASQKDKMEANTSELMTKKLLPYLYESMKSKKWDMIPYVNFEEKLENGIYGFMDSPRYSTGYSSLFNCISLVTETHMLKPFPQRVRATYDILFSTIAFCNKNNNQILSARTLSDNITTQIKIYPIHWKPDTIASEILTFKGYQHRLIPSKVTNGNRLFYDENKPSEMMIPYFNHYIASKNISPPKAYIIPQAYHQVVNLLMNSGVKCIPLKEASSVFAQFYKIENYESSSRPYESHHLNQNVSVVDTLLTKQYYSGDFVVLLNQTCNRFIIETLEPEAVDSYFSWNFFDGILNQKEWFSDYVFEDKAEKYLKENPLIKDIFDKKMKSDSEFAKNTSQQLAWVYKNSKYSETSVNIYPVARVYDMAIINQLLKK